MTIADRSPYAIRHAADGRIVAVDVRDLLALEFVEGVTDCAALAREVLRRIGRDDAALLVGGDPCSSEELCRRIDAGELPTWERIGDSPRDATEVGDLIVGPRGDGLHVAILTSVRPRLALTAIRGAHSRQVHAAWFRNCSMVLRATTPPA